VNREAGLTFASILRSALRQDPNVLLVGEVRDAETAQIAAEAALTGHLVLATLHTNNAVQAATRLIEVGVEPFAVSAAFLGAMAQRLARRLCDSCKEAYEAPPEMLARHFTNFEPHLPVKLYRAKGCRDCGQTGYSGRVGVFELMVVDAHIRELVAQNHSLAEITAAAESAGYLPMRYDALKKMLRGLTTLEEVERLTAAAE
jgi:type IV pilus assembly protein PilB